MAINLLSCFGWRKSDGASQVKVKQPTAALKNVQAAPSPDSGRKADPDGVATVRSLFTRLIEGVSSCWTRRSKDGEPAIPGGKRPGAVAQLLAAVAQRNEPPEKLMNGANLRGLNLANGKLAGMSFQDANLGGADLQNAQLQNSNLKGTDLKSAQLFNTDLTAADLTEADLRGAHGFKVDPDSGPAPISESDVWDALNRQPSPASLQGANLDLKGSFALALILGGVDLRGARWPAKLAVGEAKKFLAPLVSSIRSPRGEGRKFFTKALALEFDEQGHDRSLLSSINSIDDKQVREALLHELCTIYRSADMGLRLQVVGPLRAVLRQNPDVLNQFPNFLVDLDIDKRMGTTGLTNGKKEGPPHKQASYAVLNGVDLTSAKLEGMTFSKANLRETKLAGAELQNSDLRSADLWKAGMSGAHLQGAQLQNALMVDVNLQHAEVQNAKLRGANLSGAKLFDTDLTNADLKDTNLCGAYGFSYDVKVSEGTRPAGPEPIKKSDIERALGRPWSLAGLQGAELNLEGNFTLALILGGVDLSQTRWSYYRAHPNVDLKDEVQEHLKPLLDFLGPGTLQVEDVSLFQQILTPRTDEQGRARSVLGSINSIGDQAVKQALLRAVYASLDRRSNDELRPVAGPLLAVLRQNMHLVPGHSRLLDRLQELVPSEQQTQTQVEAEESEQSEHVELPPPGEVDSGDRSSVRASGNLTDAR